METSKLGWRTFLFPKRLVTPRGFAAVAATFAVLFLVCHALGLRSYTCVLCGQSPTGDAADVMACMLGAVYMLAWFLFVVGSPTLALASAIFRGLEWLPRRTRLPSPARRAGSRRARLEQR